MALNCWFVCIKSSILYFLGNTKLSENDCVLWKIINLPHLSCWRDNLLFVWKTYVQRQITSIQSGISMTSKVKTWNVYVLFINALLLKGPWVPSTTLPARWKSQNLHLVYSSFRCCFLLNALSSCPKKFRLDKCMKGIICVSRRTHYPMVPFSLESLPLKSRLP